MSAMNANKGAAVNSVRTVDTATGQLVILSGQQRQIQTQAEHSTTILLIRF